MATNSGSHRQRTLEDYFDDSKRKRCSTLDNNDKSTNDKSEEVIMMDSTSDISSAVPTEAIDLKSHAVSSTANSPKNHNDLEYWRGEKLDDLTIAKINLPILEQSESHQIFFKCNFESGKPPPPYPDVSIDRWNAAHVRMPFSSESFYPIGESTKPVLVSRWSIIESTLRKSIRTSAELKQAILSYNSRFKSIWDMDVIRHLCDQNLIPDGGSSTFFSRTLPAMCALALNLPVYLTQPLPLMQAGCDSSFTLSQLQIASLLANAFFCTFPRRNSRNRNAEFANYPSINFSTLLSSMRGGRNTNQKAFIWGRKLEKLRCILHYFHRVTEHYPVGSVTFTRRKLRNMAPDWSSSERSFSNLRMHINATSTIEYAGPNTLQVDFANKFLGGGVLQSGCVQEEIMFVLRPELLVSLLFAEALNPDEAFIIEGAEQYSTSKGYAESFEWTGDFQQSETNTQRDEWGRWNYAVVAIDALYFRNPQKQFNPDIILRELNKAYCGFTDELAPNRKLPPVVASGNWGCGAFRGDVELKATLQMMACLQANKALAYYTFGDKDLCDRIHDFKAFLAEQHVTIGELWNILTDTSNQGLIESDSVFNFIKEEVDKLRTAASSST